MTDQDAYWPDIDARCGYNDDPDDDFEDNSEAEILMECPYCDGNGITGCDTEGGAVMMDCSECGGTGWC